jgi:hypothetical protein
MSRDRDPVAARRTAVLISALVVLLLGVALTAAEPVPPSAVKTGMILVLALLLAARATTSVRFGRRNRALDDELTRANRAKAALAGFVATLSAAAGVLAATFFVPLQAYQVALVLLVAGSAAAGVRFVFLEARLD